MDDLYARGMQARRAGLEIERCPWLLGNRDLLRLLGREHEPLRSVEDGTVRSDPTCPWCSGWVAEEAALFNAVKVQPEKKRGRIGPVAYARRLGRRACRMGRPKSENPYTDDKLRAAWWQGWEKEHASKPGCV